MAFRSFSIRLDRTLSEIPLAKNDTAGNNIAHHHALPPATFVMNKAAAIIMKPNPKMIFLIESANSSFGSFFRRASRVLHDGAQSEAAGRSPLNTAETVLRSVPQLRQNLPSSGLEVPHLGQNISISSRFLVSAAGLKFPRAVEPGTCTSLPHCLEQDYAGGNRNVQ